MRSMRTGIGLMFVCAGAILAFAVTTNTSVFNLHTAGWVIMLIGVLGLVLPRRTYGWLSRRLVRRTYPGARVDEIAAAPYRARNPRTCNICSMRPCPLSKRRAFTHISKPARSARRRNRRFASRNIRRLPLICLDLL